MLLQSLLLALVVFLVAHPASLYFKEPRLEAVMQVSALGGVFIGLNNIGLVMFRRDLNFRMDFVTGLLTLIPIWLTWIVFKFVFQGLSMVSAPWIRALFNPLSQAHPSLFGWLAPDVAAAVFAPGGPSILPWLSHIGLVLALFIIGMEFDFRGVKPHIGKVAGTAVGTLLAPLALASALAPWLWSLAPGPGSTTAYTLFVGMTMATTIATTIRPRMNWPKSAPVMRVSKQSRSCRCAPPGAWHRRCR